MATIHKTGDSFDYLCPIPDSFIDGYFTNWSVSAQVRTIQYQKLIAELDCTWADPVTTRSLKLLKINTSTWPIGSAEMDVQFVRISDGYTISTDTVSISIIRDITHPEVVA